MRNAAEVISAAVVILEQDGLRGHVVGIPEGEVAGALRLVLEPVFVLLVVQNILWVVVAVDRGDVVCVAHGSHAIMIDNKEGPLLDWDPDGPPHVDGRPPLVLRNEVLYFLLAQLAHSMLHGCNVVVVDVHR